MADLTFKAQPLPIATEEYKQQYLNQLIRTLGLYFNQLDSFNNALNTQVNSSATLFWLSDN
jgi:hypothetical protein